MSLYQNSQGEWGVRWREGGTHRSQLIGLKSEAKDFQQRTAVRIRTKGELANNRLTLDGFLAEWWETKQGDLAQATRQQYERAIDLHILPYIGANKLIELNPGTLSRYAARIERKFGPDQTRRAMFLLQGAFKEAVKEGLVYANPMREVDKPSQKRLSPAVALTVTQVEALRNSFEGKNALRDSTLVGVLAYAGLRPGEARALTWHDVDDHIHVTKAAQPDGGIKSTKNEVERQVNLLAPLAADLKEWKLARPRFTDKRGHPHGPTKTIFPNRDGKVWTKNNWMAWTSGPFKKAKEKAGLELRAYDLRHSFATMLIHEGRLLPYVAKQIGDRQETAQQFYVHDLESYDPANRLSAEDQIRLARRLAA